MPNLIIMNAHDLGQHLGCYGKVGVPSPNIDGIAARGVRMENSFCTAPQCSPSRASLYTGRYGHANGMFGLAHHPFSWRLYDDERHLAAYLKQAGYETAHVGIQHLTAEQDEMVQDLGYEEVALPHDADQITEHAIRILERDHERPFFLNIGFFEPHRDHTGGFKGASPYDAEGVAHPPYLPDTPEARQELAELQGSIHTLDNAVGRIWEALEGLGLLRDTWVIFTTDHGLAMPRAKCTMYEPGIETAMIMYAEPFGFTGGQVVHELISHVDLLPTILEGLGIEVPNQVQGRSYWRRLIGDEYLPRRGVFASKTFHTDYEPQRAIRTERYKLIWNAEVDIINVPGDIQHSPIYPQMIDTLTVERPPFELYDLDADPDEVHNLADDPSLAEQKDRLRKQLLEWMQQTGDPLLVGPIPSPYNERALRLLHGEAT